jgi:hypothetical protein
VSVLVATGGKAAAPVLAAAPGEGQAAARPGACCGRGHTAALGRAVGEERSCLRWEEPPSEARHTEKSHREARRAEGQLDPAWCAAGRAAGERWNAGEGCVGYLAVADGRRGEETVGLGREEETVRKK